MNARFGQHVLISLNGSNIGAVGAGVFIAEEQAHSGPQKLVARTGFEPVISALRGQRPGPLDERAVKRHLTSFRQCGATHRVLQAFARWLIAQR